MKKSTFCGDCGKKMAGDKCFKCANKPKVVQFRTPAITIKAADDKNVQLMKKNMPDLMAQLAACKTSYEKFATCCIALGKPDLVNHPVGRVLLSKASDNGGANVMVAGGSR